MSNNPDWLELISMVSDLDEDRSCSRCGANNPEHDVEFCTDRRCPYRPQPRVVSDASARTQGDD